MTRVLKSAKSTEPSGWRSMPEDQPRTCNGCGEKIVLSHPEPLLFGTLDKQSFHFGCWLAFMGGGV